ncbi:hypothetical protein [Cetobacterium sp.]|uniref:Cap15 family cyclic dinucleotide receptor domain-containing protein n=1 Tax=Cetobacterium sp. TaxID=2071632 RepID=UPI003F2BA123
MHKYTNENFNLIHFSSLITTITLLLIYGVNLFFLKIGLDIQIPFDIKTILLIGGSTYFYIFYSFAEKVILKIPFLSKICKVPNLNGEWEIKGEGKNNLTKDIYPWSGKLEIEQTLGKISVRLSTTTSTSSSKSSTATLKYDKGRYILKYGYDNSPNNSAPEEMRKHSGNCEIIFTKDLLAGEANYSNEIRDRKTYGTIKLKKVI